MIVEEISGYIKISLNEMDHKRGLSSLLEENIPAFDIIKSADQSEWRIKEEYRGRLNGIIHKLNKSLQTSLF